MNNYRLYIMDMSGIHIDDFKIVSASSDADAIMGANVVLSRSPCELWLKDRLVRTFS